MRIAVTGATGFIGRPFVEEALRQGHSVLAINRTGTLAEGWEGRVEGLALDISAPADITFADLGKPDILVHLAWRNLTDFLSIDHFQIDLPMQYAFLSRLLRSGLRKLFVVGTCLEYGLQSGCLAESLPSCPITPYGFAKDALRRQLEFLQKSQPFELTWARLFYIYGDCPGRKTLYVQVRDAVARGDEVFAMSSGEQLRDFLPVEHAAQLLVKLAVAKSNSGIFNVCAGQPTSVRKLVETWLETNKWKLRLELGRYPQVAFEPFAFWGDRQRLNEAIGER